jgi:hypothetical protein
MDGLLALAFEPWRAGRAASLIRINAQGDGQLFGLPA